MYQPDRPHSGCWPQTCHISGACWWEPAVCEGFSLSLRLWWLMGACSLKDMYKTCWETERQTAMEMSLCTKTIKQNIVLRGDKPTHIIKRVAFHSHAVWLPFLDTVVKCRQPFLDIALPMYIFWSFKTKITLTADLCVCVTVFSQTKYL